MKVKFSILGEPQGKGRPKTVRLKNGASSTYTPNKTVLYENLIATEYRRQVGVDKFPDDAMLDMHVTAYCKIPSSASKKKKADMLSGVIRPTKKPDADNVLKAVADSLNNIAYRDDSQIVNVQVQKFYSDHPRLEVLIQEVHDGQI